MPFRHADRTHDLSTRIDMEVRERLEEAVDFVCLEALVQERRQRGLPPPAADNSTDRRDYLANVSAFLTLLQRDLTANLTADQRERLGAATAASGDAETKLVSTQVALARLLPDYWQRFDTLRARYLEGAEAQRERAVGDDSGRESRGLLGRLFGRG
ncbi:MAG: hypothetical protein ACHQ7H_18330 [Candidatus Rokuibacteriota bacterium]